METAKTVAFWLWQNRDEILLALTIVGGLTKNAWIIEAAKIAGKVVPRKKQDGGANA